MLDLEDERPDDDFVPTHTGCDGRRLDLPPCTDPAPNGPELAMSLRLSLAFITVASWMTPVIPALPSSLLVHRASCVQSSPYVRSLAVP